LPVTVEPKHLALWKRAHAVTQPSTVNKPPTYGAWHRQRAERRVTAEPEEREAEAPTVEGIGASG